MPVSLSAKKALRRDRRREKFNQKIKRQLKLVIGSFHKNPSQKNLSQVFSLLDKASKKKFFHKNKATRLKSRLANLVKSKKK